jgi:hypothetical protein
VLLKHSEYSIQQSSIHAAPGLNFKRDDIPFRRDRAYAVSRAHARRNLSAMSLGMARVQHINRNVLSHCRRKSCRVQHLGSKVRQVSSFIEAKLTNDACIGADLRISRHDSVHIRPDFDSRCANRGSDNSCAEVRPAAP